MKKWDWKKIMKIALNEGEDYVGTVLFIIMTILLTMQVITRYVFNFAFTWTEELSVIMFVWLIYFGVSGAVTKRKHLKIDAVINVLPYKIKKFVLVLDNVVTFVFCAIIIPVLMPIIQNFAKRNAVTSLMRLPKAAIYAVIPFGMVLTGIRLIQDTIKLLKENEQTLGKSKPAIDIDALEAEYKASLERKQQRKGE